MAERLTFETMTVRVPSPEMAAAEVRLAADPALRERVLKQVGADLRAALDFRLRSLIIYPPLFPMG